VDGEMFATNKNARLKTVQQKMVRGESKKKSHSNEGCGIKAGEGHTSRIEAAN
jgi:hypothetical protein